MKALAELTTGRSSKDLIWCRRSDRLLLRRAAPSHPHAEQSRPPNRPTRMTDRANLLNPEPAFQSSPALPISGTIICKNEEACIGRCLSSLEGLAEIVV